MILGRLLFDCSGDEVSAWNDGFSCDFLAEFVPSLLLFVFGFGHGLLSPFGTVDGVVAPNKGLYFVVEKIYVRLTDNFEVGLIVSGVHECGHLLPEADVGLGEKSVAGPDSVELTDDLLFLVLLPLLYLSPVHVFHFVGYLIKSFVEELFQVQADFLQLNAGEGFHYLRVVASVFRKELYYSVRLFLWEGVVFFSLDFSSGLSFFFSFFRFWLLLFFWGGWWFAAWMLSFLLFWSWFWFGFLFSLLDFDILFRTHLLFFDLLFFCFLRFLLLGFWPWFWLLRFFFFPFLLLLIGMSFLLFLFLRSWFILSLLAFLIFTVVILLLLLFPVSFRRFWLPLLLLFSFFGVGSILIFFLYILVLSSQDRSSFGLFEWSGSLSYDLVDHGSLLFFWNFGVFSVGACPELSPSSIWHVVQGARFLLVAMSFVDHLLLFKYTRFFAFHVGWFSTSVALFAVLLLDFLCFCFRWWLRGTWNAIFFIRLCWFFFFLLFCALWFVPFLDLRFLLLLWLLLRLFLLAFLTFLLFRGRIFSDHVFVFMPCRHFLFLFDFRLLVSAISFLFVFFRLFLLAFSILSHLVFMFVLVLAFLLFLLLLIQYVFYFCLVIGFWIFLSWKFKISLMLLLRKDGIFSKFGPVGGLNKKLLLSFLLFLRVQELLAFHLASGSFLACAIHGEIKTEWLALVEL